MSSVSRTDRDNADGNPVVGWIKDAGVGFVNSLDAFAMSELRDVPLRDERLEYFRCYASRYYSERFTPGQGTEHILANLQTFGARAGRWLDLGCGTTTFLWSIPLGNVSSISCCDIVPEALVVLRETVAARRIPTCYRQVLEMHGKSEQHLHEMWKRLERVLVFDALGPWPRSLIGQGYDLITAMGLFGIAPTQDRYAEAVQHVADGLVPGGRAIGADWVRRPEFIRADGHDNSYLSPLTLIHAARRAGLGVLKCEQVPIEGDPQYQSVICWAVQR